MASNTHAGVNRTIYIKFESDQHTKSILIGKRTGFMIKHCQCLDFFLEKTTSVNDKQCLHF